MLPSQDSFKSATKNGKTAAKAPAAPAKETQKSAAKTRIVIKYDVGFSNNVAIRGNGANLNWDKGIPLKNLKADEWVWETDGNFSQCEFKVLINDRQFESGENHTATAGASIVYTPRF